MHGRESAITAPGREVRYDKIVRHQITFYLALSFVLVLLNLRT